MTPRVQAEGDSLMGTRAMTPAYKVFTHDLRSPIQGGDPVWDGLLPFSLPRVEVDTSEETCAEGWNACARPEDALRIAGLWPDGRPSRLFRVETSDEVVARKDKLRAATWTIVAEVADAVEPAIRTLSERWFAPQHVELMVAEQMAWREALARPHRNEEAVERGLIEALRARGLGWRLRRFGNAMAAMVARAAWAAMDALITQYASLVGAMNVAPDRYTVGIRDAYRNGLAIAIPTGPGELGWAIDKLGLMTGAPMIRKGVVE